MHFIDFICSLTIIVSIFALSKSPNYEKDNTISRYPT